MAAHPDIAGDVRAALARHRITQGDLAQRIGMNQSTLSRRLSGETDFTVPELTSIAEQLDVAFDELVPSLRRAS